MAKICKGGNMKLAKSLVILLFLVLFANASVYTGFMKLKPGSWALYESKSSDGQEVTIKLKFLGTTLYKGKKVNIVESESQVGKTKIVTQQWSAVDNDSMIEKIITKMPQGVMCMEEEMINTMRGNKVPNYHTKTPKKFSPKRPDIRYGTYTLPNGKKLRVAIFKTKDGEVWVSSEVPFGIVKVVHNGKTVMKLLDFALAGAKPAISLKEAKTCAPLQLPF